MKTVLPISDSNCNIPGLGLDASDNLNSKIDYRHSALNISSSLSSSTPSTTISNLINPTAVNHSTPLSIKSLTFDTRCSSTYASQNSQKTCTGNFEPLSNSNLINPLPPPPMPPSIFMDDEPCYNKLPPKFPTWTFANEIEPGIKEIII